MPALAKHLYIAIASHLPDETEFFVRSVLVHAR